MSPRRPLVAGRVADMTTRRLVSSTSLSRSYPEALRLLSQLQSNRQTTQLFDQPGSSSGSSSGPKPWPPSLNAAALPEMGAWLRRAGYSPGDLARLRHIHVAGTKGKGSVCAFATGMLRRCGRRVGTYTSPHLVSVRERIAVDGAPVSQPVFAAAFFELWDRFTDAARAEGAPPGEAAGPASKPFFFRFLTLLAWHVFLRTGVDSVVLECGIGGEYDATNVLPPEAVSAAVVTQLGVDHVAMLGDTVEQIAWHKAGIFKPGVRGFTRRLPPGSSVAHVLRQRAAEKGAALVEVDDGAVERWGGVAGGIAGDFQKYNQALAVMAVREHLGLGGDAATALLHLPDDMVQGLREARIRGRCDVVQQGSVGWHLDGAHTKDSLEQVAAWFCQTLAQDESAILVFNQQERNAVELLSGFLDTVRSVSGRRHVFSHALLTRNDLQRPVEGEARDVDVQRRAAAFMKGQLPSCPTCVFDNLQDAVAEARRLAAAGAKSQKVLVTGSMHLVGGILRTLEPDSLL